MTQRRRLGAVTGGTLVSGLQVRLDAGAPIEQIRIGTFAVVCGRQYDFLCMVTDLALASSSPAVAADPPDDDPFLQEVLLGTAAYGTLSLTPRLMLARDGSSPYEPVRTIPGHFSPVFEADAADFARVFGEEQGNVFQIGRPLDMDVPVCIDLTRLIERSNGVFGKSGTGKSFLTRLLLSGTIMSGVAANLIFDMHGEYGWQTPSEGGGFVKGLRQLFGSDVAVYSVGPVVAGRRADFDGELRIGLNEIDIEDVLLLEQELNLSQTATETAALVADAYRTDWLSGLLNMDMEQVRSFCESSGAHEGSLSALKRKLANVQRLPFIQDRADRRIVDEMIGRLQAGKHVVLSFGPHISVLGYMLVANIITRRIHRQWQEATERYIRSQNRADKPQPLMITIEEAHKFLNPQQARQSIFGTIARELRKFSVTLLVVDQRPSSIDNEVMSQLGTRITALLTDERDIDAVFTGVGGAQQLKAVLAGLDTRQQALVLGHAVPLPVVIRTRAYDDEFYRAVETRRRRLPVAAETADVRFDPEQDVADLFGDD
jgi:DNA helicase HerA-like ATPase